MRLILAFTVLVFTAQFSVAQQIKWVTWNEIEGLMEKEPRKIIVDVYTEWCGWCKKMDKNTFGNPNIANYINENYYAIKFDAEQKSTIHLKGDQYNYIRTTKRGYNELAAHILRGQLSFPTIVFLDENIDVIQPIPGYQDVQTLQMMLGYFAGDYHKTTPWRTYAKNYGSKPKAKAHESKKREAIEVQTVSNPK